jgi:hypothetical protein
MRLGGDPGDETAPAGELAGRQRQEQRPEPDRTDLSAMSRHIWLVVVFVLVALIGCAQETAGQGSAPYAPSRDSGPDIRGM